MSFGETLQSESSAGVAAGSPGLANTFGVSGGSRPTCTRCDCGYTSPSFEQPHSGIFRNFQMTPDLMQMFSGMFGGVFPGVAPRKKSNPFLHFRDSPDGNTSEAS